MGLQANITLSLNFVETETYMVVYSALLPPLYYISLYTFTLSIKAKVRKILKGAPLRLRSIPGDHDDHHDRPTLPHIANCCAKNNGLCG